MGFQFTMRVLVLRGWTHVVGSQAFEHSYFFRAVRSSDMYISGQACSLQAVTVLSVSHLREIWESGLRAFRHFPSLFFVPIIVVDFFEHVDIMDFTIEWLYLGLICWLSLPPHVHFWGVASTTTWASGIYFVDVRIVTGSPRWWCSPGLPVRDVWIIDVIWVGDFGSVSLHWVLELWRRSMSYYWWVIWLWCSALQLFYDWVDCSVPSGRACPCCCIQDEMTSIETKIPFLSALKRWWASRCSLRTYFEYRERFSASSALRGGVEGDPDRIDASPRDRER